jgi:hypothetical protein
MTRQNACLISRQLTTRAISSTPPARAVTQEDFKASRDVRGAFLDSEINIEQAVDEVLCELFRIDFGHRSIFKETLMGVTTRAKIDALREMLKEVQLASGTFKKIAARLTEMNNNRNTYAHSWVTRGPASDDDAPRDLIFSRYTTASS